MQPGNMIDQVGAESFFHSLIGGGHQALSCLREIRTRCHGKGANPQDGAEENPVLDSNIPIPGELALHIKLNLIEVAAELDRNLGDGKLLVLSATQFPEGGKAVRGRKDSLRPHGGRRGIRMACRTWGLFHCLPEGPEFLCLTSKLHLGLFKLLIPNKQLLDQLLLGHPFI